MNIKYFYLILSKTIVQRKLLFCCLGLKMKHLKVILLLILLSGAAQTASACDVINGSDIKFIHISRYKYHVKFILYHQCVCKLGIMPKFTISCDQYSFTFVPLVPKLETSHLSAAMVNRHALTTATVAHDMVLRNTFLKTPSTLSHLHTTPF